MISKEKLESYMLDLSLSYEEQDDDIYVVHSSDLGLENVVVMLDDPIVIIQVKVICMAAPRLLEQMVKMNSFWGRLRTMGFRIIKNHRMWS